MDTEKLPKKRARGRPRSLFHDPQPTTIQALERGLVVLEHLARNSGTTLSGLAYQMDLPASTTHRILTTLQERGFVSLDETTQEWSIGIETFRVGSAYLVRTNLVEAARNVMRQLMEDTGETANLAIADQGDVVFVSQVETHNPIRAFFRPGSRSPMHASGIGKALLAEMGPREFYRVVEASGLKEYTPNTLTTPDGLREDLSTTRERGWSFDNEERYLGMRCIAAAIHNAFGEAVAGISISGPTVRFPDEILPGLGRTVAAAALEVTGLIGGHAPEQIGDQL